MSEDEKKDALSKVTDVEGWINSNQEADKDEIDQKSNEFKESVAQYGQKLGVGATGESEEDYSADHNTEDL